THITTSNPKLVNSVLKATQFGPMLGKDINITV
ncbi:unnamed protein product, partial [marine sediment metagenome]